MKIDVTSLLVTIVGTLIGTWGLIKYYVDRRLDKKLAVQTQQILSLVSQHTTATRLDFFRFMHQVTDGTDDHYYWHFKWRFETYDYLSLNASGEDREFHCEVKILGQSNPDYPHGYEAKPEEDYYIAEIVDSSASDGKGDPPLSDGQLVGCFAFNGKLLLTRGKGASLSDLPQYKFEIVGLGHTQIVYGSATRTVDEGQQHLRIKDQLKDR